MAVPLTPELVKAYDVEGNELTAAAVAYVRARGADPKCSFGDFAALSEVVDLPTAEFLKGVVSDGIVAPGFEPQALKILKSKKQGSFIVIEADAYENLVDKLLASSHYGERWGRFWLDVVRYAGSARRRSSRITDFLLRLNLPCQVILTPHPSVRDSDSQPAGGRRSDLEGHPEPAAERWRTAAAGGAEEGKCGKQGQPPRATGRARPYQDGQSNRAAATA